MHGCIVRFSPAFSFAANDAGYFFKPRINCIYALRDQDINTTYKST